MASSLQGLPGQWTIQVSVSAKTDLISKTHRHFKPLLAKASRPAGLMDHPRTHLGQTDP
jgi:hypothetical protein